MARSGGGGRSGGSGHSFGGFSGGGLGGSRAGAHRSGAGGGSRQHTASGSSKSFGGSAFPHVSGGARPGHVHANTNIPRYVVFNGPSYKRTVPRAWEKNVGYNPGQGCATSGCSTFLVVVLILLVFLFIFSLPSMTDCSDSLNTSSVGSSQIAPSTIERQPLESGAVNETGYYTDECDWISDPGTLESGMRSFYRQTGVQPYIYIAKTVNGTNEPSVSEISAYADQLYLNMFTDEGHFLVVFCDNDEGGYAFGYYVGASAGTVMDKEALQIFGQYLSMYYSSSLSDEEFFSKTFHMTAERIMTVTKSPWPGVLLVSIIILAVVIIIIVAYRWWQKSKEKKEAEQKRLDDILNKPLETYADKELNDLEKKYSDKT